ncbi:calcium-binding protein [uncultured Methylobacterium sp.]|jgi:Ca2+-binding RTX toxin-like protein|uniref:calcium-binding protein n=1 Tax=uncultured Methylobacterium sp. TaxID=157278 RepID=UPI00262FD929|nr:calcium-binding protein [uncultured Methylobacterium sp.]
MAAPDTTKPRLTSLTLPGSVDLSGGNKSVSVSVGATDEGLGVDTVSVIFDKSFQSTYGRSSSFVFRDSDDSFVDGSSSDSELFTTATGSGTYTVSLVGVYDKAGNFTSYSTAELQAAGFQTSFTVTGAAAADSAKPRLTSLTLPNSVDLSGGNKSVSVSVGAADEGLGVDTVTVIFDKSFQSTYGRSSSFVFRDSDDSFADGSSSDSELFTTATGSGTYTVSLVGVYDKAGNFTSYSTAELQSAGFRASFAVTGGAGSDTIKPRLTSLTLPSSVDLSGGNKSVSMSVGAADEGLGVDTVTVIFDKSFQSIYGRSSSFVFRDSDDSFADGSSSDSELFTTATGSGTYTVSLVGVYDKAGNFTSYSTAELQAAGFQTSFTVTDGLTRNLNLVGTSSNETLTGGDGSDYISGLGGDDTLIGGAGTDTVFGDAGADRINGGDGADELRGYFGNDTIFGDFGDDRIYGEQDDDFIGAGAGNDSLFGGDGADALIGETGNDTIFGEYGDDFLDGREDDDFIGAGAGNDLVLGGSGNDALIGETGNDTIFGEYGNDFLDGREGRDFLGAGAGDDVLSGGADDDGLNGEDGNDLLFGNSGNDALVGGRGSDVFAFGRGDGRDIIQDFTVSGAERDVIAFNGGVFASFEQVRAASQQIGMDTIITIGAETSVVVQNVSLASLTADNFMFG